MKTMIIYLPILLAFCGTLVVAVGAYSRGKSSKRIALIGTILAAVGAVWTAIQTAQSESKIETFNTYMLSTITGGDSFCRLSLMTSDPSSINVSVIAVPMGDFPLYDVNFRIVDVTELSKVRGDITLEKLSKAQVVLEAGNLNPGQFKILGEMNLGGGNEKKLNVFISARNGSFTQLIRWIRRDGRWITATKVCRDTTKLWERVDNAFPKNAAGAIDWD